MLTVLHAAALEHHVVELVAGDGERLVGTSVRGAAPPRRLRLPCADRIPHSWSLITTLATPSRTMTSPPTFPSRA